MTSYRGILALIGLLWAGLCLADNTTYRTKLGFDIKALKTNPDPRIGWLVGVRGERFLGTSQFHVGVAGYYGTPTGGSPSTEHLWYAGASFGYDGKFNRMGIFELGIVGGYGQGTIKDLMPSTYSVSYFVVEPSASIGLMLGGGWRGAIAASYLHMTGAPTFSGPCFGLRFEYRSATTIRDLND